MVVLRHLPFIGAFVSSQVPSVYDTIIMQVRLPRIIAGLLVGAALSASGVSYQALFKNPMADPYVLGVSAGAAVGASIAIVAHLGQGGNLVPFAAFLGAVMTSLFVYRMGRVGGRTSVTTLLLAGIASSVFLSSLVTLAIVLSNPYTGELQGLIFWLFGSLAGSNWDSLRIATPLILGGLVLMSFFGRQLNILTVDGMPEQLGLDADKVKKAIIVVASIVTSAAVALSGIIGFVGLIIPHITRMLVGPDHRVLLPSAALVGAIFLVSFDSVARVIYSPSEFPVGLITALAGGPFFLYLLRAKKGEYSI